MIDYLNELRDACLEAYTGIIQGLKGEDEKNVSRKYICVSWDISNRAKLTIFVLIWRNQGSNVV